jgi:hypothetical protein
VALVTLAFACESLYWTKVQFYKNKNEVDINAYKGSQASVAVDVFALLIDIITFIRDLRDRRRDTNSGPALHQTTTNNIKKIGSLLLKPFKQRTGFVPGDLKMMGLLLSGFYFLAGGAILIACNLKVERFRSAGDSLIVPRWKVDCRGMSLLLEGGRREEEVDCTDPYLSRRVEAFSDTS